jgi:hypothetical protein
MVKGRTSELVDRVQNKFGNKQFTIEDCDPKTRQLVLKFLCHRKNIPNTTSINFEICELKKGFNYTKKKFRLKGDLL